MRILIVDDNRALAENVSEILCSISGVECLVANDGRRALDLARTQDFQVAFIDLRLPDVSGTELLAGLRQLAPHAQQVIITGDATVESAILAVKEGAFAYVLKPVRGEDLLETARRALAQARLVKERESLRSDLERSERRHREVVDAVPAFVLALDGSGKIVLWNRHLEQITHFTRSEMVGQSGDHLVGSHDEPRALPLKPGGYRLVRWQRSEVSLGNEAPVTYAIGVDVTEETEMLRRTMRAERLAAVGTLAAGLAHEVRNPLNSALLQLNVLDRRIDRGKMDPDSLKPVTALVKQEIQRLDRLVNEFLAFAQPRPLSLSLVAMNDLVRGVVELVAPEVASTKTRIDLDLDPAAGTVQGEPERLRQVLLNLVRNGIEAMLDGGTLTVATRRPDARGHIEVSVTDTGHGFAEDAPVFDAFYTTKEGGTGLGLSIVHRIVSEHGGSVTVKSKPGLTRFTFTLPQHTPAVGDDAFTRANARGEA
jgi:signal transduction histidine kinase